MDCGHHQPQPENVERGMHHNDRRSVSGCQENRAKPASWGWSCRDRDAARDENCKIASNNDPTSYGAQRIASTRKSMNLVGSRFDAKLDAGNLPFS